MSFLRISPVVLAAASLISISCSAQAIAVAQLPAHATLPITFSKTVSAAHAKPGDLILARTSQAIRLTDGREVSSGALVKGHVLSAKAFTYDNTPYAKQAAGSLEVQVDSLEVEGQSVRLHVSLRAMADPITVSETYESYVPDNIPQAETELVGGDRISPTQKEIHNQDGDVVGYNKKGGPFGHLIANSNGRLSCDGGDTEQPISRFSPSACGLYGFTDVFLTSFDSSHIGLASTRVSPKIWKSSTALLETMPDETASR
jgi:hypothetical protein